MILDVWFVNRWFSIYDLLTGDSQCLICPVRCVKENDKEMISNLLVFRARLDVMVNTTCDGNDSYRYKLKEAFEGFLNARQGLIILIMYSWY